MSRRPGPRRIPVGGNDSVAMRVHCTYSIWNEDCTPDPSCYSECPPGFPYNTCQPSDDPSACCDESLTVSCGYRYSSGCRKAPRCERHPRRAGRWATGWRRGTRSRRSRSSAALWPLPAGRSRINKPQHRAGERRPDHAATVRPAPMAPIFLDSVDRPRNPALFNRLLGPPASKKQLFGRALKGTRQTQRQPPFNERPTSPTVLHEIKRTLKHSPTT